MSTNLYPFLSKAQIKDRLATDDAFVVECLKIMHSRQTVFEQETRQTVVRNRAGFMSSHAVNGTRLALRAQSEGLDEIDLAHAREIVSHYTKQLASHFREVSLQENPALKAAARVFGV